MLRHITFEGTVVSVEGRNAMNRERSPTGMPHPATDARRKGSRYVDVVRWHGPRRRKR